LIFAAVTTERVVWSSISSISGFANHRLFLPSSVQCIEAKLDTAIGSALVYHADRPTARACLVIGSEGFCRYMSDSQVADAISTVKSEQFLSAVKDLVNISTLGSVAGARVDDEQIPECSCILLRLQSL
jgi:hypothetical protein